VVSKPILVVAVVTAVAFVSVAAIFWYGESSFMGIGKSDQGIMIGEYSAVPEGASYNLTLTVVNWGRGTQTLGIVSIAPPSHGYSKHGVTLGNYSDVVLSENETITFSYLLMEDTVSQIGSNPQLQVETVDNNFNVIMDITVPGEFHRST